MGHENHPADAPPLLETANPAMARAIATARRVAASEAAVLLIGESGTGKHVLARAMHGWSPRRARPFVTVPCAAVVERRGGGAALADPGWLQGADGGTLFFDDIGELPAAEQATLLRVFDEQWSDATGRGHPVGADLRVMAATRRDIEADVQAGRFRADLFFRVSVVTIRLPPLRERAEDLATLTGYFLARLTAHHERGPLHLTPEVLDILQRYHWPGNVRELWSVLERLVVLSRGPTPTPDDLPDRVRAPARDARATPAQPRSLHELERHEIERAVCECTTLEAAATRLGINPSTLWRKRKRYRVT